MKKANKVKATGINPDHPRWMRKQKVIKAPRDQGAVAMIQVTREDVWAVIPEGVAATPVVTQTTGNFKGFFKKSA
jgi:hypothetical protein